MKKIFGVLLIICCMIFLCAQAENNFTQALKTCEKFSQLGGVNQDGQYYNILITLEKNKKSCMYKEKIYQQNSGSQTLSCVFSLDDTKDIAQSMDKFTAAYAKEIAKNKIHESKLTNNFEVFERYLINPKYCQITQSKTN